MYGEKLQKVTKVTYVILILFASVIYGIALYYFIKNKFNFDLRVTNHYVQTTIYYVVAILALTINKYVLLTFGEISQNLKK